MEQKTRLRASNTSLVRDLARRTGMTHAQVNAELNRLAGLRRIGDATSDAAGAPARARRALDGQTLTVGIPRALAGPTGLLPLPGS